MQLIDTKSNGEALRVEITKKWLDDPDDWWLPLQETKTTDIKGTRIRVTELYPEIAHQFSSDTAFLDDLHGRIAELFAVIIEKGFEVSLNEAPIRPVPLKLILNQQSGISPYIFRGKVKGVNAEVVRSGFHRDPIEGRGVGGR